MSKAFPAAALIAVIALALPAAAEDEHERSGITHAFGDLDVTLTLDAGLGLFSVQEAQNGAGSLSRNGRSKSDRNWAEGFVAPGLGLDYHAGESTIYGGFKLLGSFTRGDGDAQRNSSTSDRPEALGIEEAFIGWKSGSLFAALGDDAVDATIGRQSFQVGDGFLIADGTAEGFRRGAYVMGPRGAFDRTALLKLNTAPVRADLFHLEGQVDQDFMNGNDAAATKLYGGNIEFFQSGHKDHGRFEYDERLWYVGLTGLHVYEADRALAATRDGLDVYSLRTGGALLSSLGEAFSDFAFFSEYAIQRNEADGGKVRANAWYVEPQYTFSALPWSPRISYRYAHFSGNDDGDDTDETWDSLYTGGGPRGYGTWDLGEIYARYVGGNANLNSHMVHLRLQPADELAVGAIYYRHLYDEPDTGSGITSDKRYEEVNVYAEWETPLPGLSVTGVLGAGKAGRGREQELGVAANETTYLGQVVFGYSF